jgi:DNA-binding IscR family transcriptional regulator
VGGEVAYFCQYPYLASAAGTLESQAERERCALSALSLIAARHLRGEPPYQLAELAHVLRVPIGYLEELTDLFAERGALLRSSAPPGVALARSPESVSVLEILDALRSARAPAPRADMPVGVVRTLWRERQALDQALGDVTLASLASEEPDVEASST